MKYLADLAVIADKCPTMNTNINFQYLQTGCDIKASKHLSAKKKKHSHYYSNNNTVRVIRLCIDFIRTKSRLQCNNKRTAAVLEQLLSKLGHEFVIIGSRDNHNDCFRNPTRGTQHNNANEKKNNIEKVLLEAVDQQKKN